MATFQIDPLLSFGDGNQNGEYVLDEGALGDLHLSSAINLDRIRQLVTGESPGYRTHCLVREDREYQLLCKRYCPRSYSHKAEILPLLLSINSGGDELSALPTEAMGFIWKILKTNLKDRSCTMPLSTNDYETALKSVKVSKRSLDYFNNMTKFVCYRSEFLRDGRQSRIKPDFVVERGHTIEMTLLTEMGPIILGSGSFISYAYVDQLKVLYVFNFECILLLLDNLGQRICAEVASRYGNASGIPGSIDPVVLRDVLEIGDNLLRERGNVGYEQIGMFEAFCVAELLRRSPDGITKADEFLNNCREEFYTGFNEGDIVHKTYDSFMSLLKRVSSADVSNVFCLYRCWGHPVVNIFEGMKKVHTIATKKKTITSMVGEIVLLQFRKMYLTSYKKKKGFYPPVKLNGESYIVQCIRDGNDVQMRHPEYCFADWNHVELQQSASIPASYDICHILNDKAVSPNLDELVSTIRAGKGTSAGGLRRGILRWMKGNTPPCKEFLEDIDQNGFTQNELLTGMYEKEREIKVAARMYTLMTEKMRYYFVLTEELIANEILPCFPEITMKDSLNVLMKKLWTAGGRRSKGSMDVNINIDFSKWNTNMRTEFSLSLFQEMDKIFGMTNLISRTHEIFTNCLVYSCSGMYEPHLDENGDIVLEPPMCYRGHLGGFEGLRQKGWTVATVCMLVYTAEMEGLKCGLMGQGDNQIIRIQMPVHRWEAGLYDIPSMKIKAAEKASSMIARMDTHFGLAGLPMKVRETWLSSRLFMYGKVMLLDGEQLPQWYKKVLRSYALSNEGTLTISGVIGVIATNMCAAAGVSERPDLIYLLFLSLGEWSLHHLLDHHPFTRKSYEDGEIGKVMIPGPRRYANKTTPPLHRQSLIVLLLTVPTSVGGSIVIPLTSYIFRGFPDKASEGYAWLKLLGEGNHPMVTMFKNFYSFLKNDTIELDMLVQSPMSLNHKRPPTPGLQSRDTVREWLLSPSSFPANRFLRGMREVDMAFKRKEICMGLCPNVTNPIIAHEVYETYPHVYLDGFCRRIESTRTIKAMRLNDNNRLPIIKKLMNAENNFIWYIWWRAHQRGLIYSTCATKQARDARTIGWGRKIVGVTTPHPLELTCGRVCTDLKRCTLLGDFVYTKVASCGDYAPYLGSKIRVKVSSAQDEEAGREPLIVTGSRLARYVSWLKLGSNYLNVVTENVSAICDTSIFESFLEEEGVDNMHTGSVMHRFLPGGISEGCFINYSPQVGHKVFMSSDNMPKYGRGQTNYTLHFQALYCWIQYVTHSAGTSTFFHHHMECEDCIVPVEDDYDDIQGNPPTHELAHSESVITRIREILGYLDEVPRVILGKRDKPACGVRCKIEDVMTVELYHGLVDLCSYKAAKEILSSSLSTSMSTGMEDLQGYPRIYAYKMNREDVFMKTCIWLLLLSGVKEDLPPVDVHLNVLRKRLQDKIASMNINNLSLLGALCLGRDQISENSPLMIIEGTCFPETPYSYLEQIKQSLVLSLSRITFSKSSIWSKTVLPSTEVTDEIILATFAMKSLFLYNCPAMFRLWGEFIKGSTEMVFRECGHQCQLKCYKTTHLVNATIDRVVKCLPVRKLKYKSDRRVEKYPDPLVVSVRVSRPARTPGHEVLFDTIWGSDSSAMKIIRYPTSSIYKWDPLFNWVASVLGEVNHVIMLGDGVGGSSLAASVNHENANIFPLSKLEKYEMIPQDLMSMMPPLSRMCPNVSASLMMTVPDDIYHPRWGQVLQSEIADLNGRVLICSDLEGSGGDGKGLVKIIKSLPSGVSFMIKTYAKTLSTNYNKLYGIDNVKLACPVSSNLRYQELWLIGDKIDDATCMSGMSLEFSLEKMRELSFSVDHNTIVQSLVTTERKYPDLVKLSMSILLSRLSRLGIIINPGDILLPGFEIITYMYQYINTHYFFAGKRYDPADRRMITRKIKKDLEDAIRILIIGTIESHEELLTQLGKLNLVHVKRGLTGRKFFRIIFNYSKTDGNPLDKDVVKCGIALMQFRKSKGVLQIPWTGELGSPLSHGLLKGASECSYSDQIGYSLPEDED